MSIGLPDQNLIFLISQPRAGSTLLQRVLGSHPDIHTLSEPWLMLHPLYALSFQGHTAQYVAAGACRALQGFIEALPNGKQDYIDGVRLMYSHLYRQALAHTQAQFFLDKTPRYYLILPELYRVFPNAKYIILMRNPLAVLCSLLNSWTNRKYFYFWKKRNYFRLYSLTDDLLHAPHLLLEGIELLRNRVLVIHYEQLIMNPEVETLEICRWLHIDYEPSMLDYGRHQLPYWHFGDKNNIYRHTRPSSEYAAKWVESINDPQVWRLANDYLTALGQDAVERIGYSYEELKQILEVHRPRAFALRLTFSLAFLLKRPPEERKFWERSLRLLLQSLGTKS